MEDRLGGALRRTTSARDPGITQPHNHCADIADYEVREAFSQVQDLAATTITQNYRIYCFVTGSLLQDARLLLPSEQTEARSKLRETTGRRSLSKELQQTL